MNGDEDEDDFDQYEIPVHSFYEVERMGKVNKGDFEVTV